jgi:NAD-specific glutamate dehydrogenase
VHILEWEVLDITLNLFLGHLATDETLDIVDGVVWVSRGLVLGGVSDQSLLIGKGDIRGGDTISLVVDENLDLTLLHNTDTSESWLAVVP